MRTAQLIAVVAVTVVAALAAATLLSRLHDGRCGLGNRGLDCSLAPALPVRSADDVAAVWAAEQRYWTATAAHDDVVYQRLWHPDFLGWPCGEALPVTGKPPPFEKDGIKLSWTMDKRAATSGERLVSTFYHVRETGVHPDGRVEVTDYEITHTWVPTDDGWKIISGMCRHPAP
jgi:hypothetical protein